MPTSGNEALGQYVSLAEGAGQFERGEKTLLAQLGHPVHTQQKFWLIRRLNELYRRAVDDSEDVSLGRGETLYKALEKKLFVNLASPDQTKLSLRPVRHDFSLGFSRTTRLYSVSRSIGSRPASSMSRRSSGTVNSCGESDPASW